MIYIFGTGHEISVITDTTGLTSADLLNASAVVVELPTPAVVEGKRPMLYLDPQTKELSYKYVKPFVSKPLLLKQMLDAGKISQEDYDLLTQV